MAGKTRSEKSHELDELRGRIEHWRATRRGHGRMPEALWVAASRAARKMGVSRVASELKLGFVGLKQRVDKSPQKRMAHGFVELTGAQVLGTQSGAGTVIERLKPDGTRLTVTVGSGSTADVVSLVAAMGGL